MGCGELCLCVCFDGGEKRNALGRAEEIDVGVGNRLAFGGIDDGAVNRSGKRYGGGEKCGEGGGKQTRPESLHRGRRPPAEAGSAAAGRAAGRGRRICDSVTCSISATTRAASFSRVTLMVS